MTSKSRRSPAGTAEAFWADAATGRRKGDYPVHWLQSDLVLRHCVNPRISGEPEVGWLEWVQKTFIPREVERGFVLGCGGGLLERNAARLGICRRFLAVDLSAEAIAVSSTLAQREGWEEFEYQALDANHLELPARAFDLILAEMSLHHIERLEHVLEQFRKALRPEGVVVLNEFVGPDHFQWTDAQLAASTRLIRSLPLRLRRNRDLAHWKRWLKPWVWRSKRWTVEKMIRIDPSESVRSSEIPQLAEQIFDVVERKPYGGALLSLVLNNIVGNFSPRDVEVLRSLASQEEAMMRSGAVGSDYELFICR